MKHLSQQGCVNNKDPQFKLLLSIPSLGPHCSLWAKHKAGMSFQVCFVGLKVQAEQNFTSFPHLR